MTEVTAGPLGEFRAASTAAGGTALTTTAQCIRLPMNSAHVFLTPRNFVTAAVVKVAFNPWMRILLTKDNMITRPKDLSELAQDRNAATSGIVLNDFSTLANGDFILMGTHLPIRGVLVDVENTNAGSATTLTVGAWNGSSFADTSATDGTSSGSKSLAQDGAITWTVPTVQVYATLEEIAPLVPWDLPADIFPGRREKLLWLRFVWSVVLDSSTDLNSILALNRSTAYGELVSGQPLEQVIEHGVPGGIGCIEALTDAGTANLIVNTASRRGAEFR